MIGVPREIKTRETRVSVTPSGVKKLTSAGHTVLVEENAGLLSGFSNQEYTDAGAKIESDVNAIWDKAEMIVRKGTRAAIDSYSAFYENDRTTATGLAGYLRERGFTRIFICGLATDF